VLGLAGALSPFVWRGLIERAHGGQAITLVMLALFVGAALPLVSSQSGALFVSGALFGGSFLAVVSSITALSRRALPAHAWGGAISALTAVFGAGQILGPVLSGALSDALGGLNSSLAWSAGVILLGAIVALFQQRVTATPS
jgi:MFS family permease